MIAPLVLAFLGWPAWVHHARGGQHWRVLEIIERDTTAANPRRGTLTSRLAVHRLSVPRRARRIDTLISGA